MQPQKLSHSHTLEASRQDARPVLQRSFAHDLAGYGDFFFVDDDYSAPNCVCTGGRDPFITGDLA